MISALATISVLFTAQILLTCWLWKQHNLVWILIVVKELVCVNYKKQDFVIHIYEILLSKTCMEPKEAILCFFILNTSHKNSALSTVARVSRDCLWALPVLCINTIDGPSFQAHALTYTVTPTSSHITSVGPKCHQQASTSWLIRAERTRGEGAP